VFAQYATAKIGAILVNINPAYRVHELQYVLTQAGIRTLIATPSFKTSDYAAMIEEVLPSAKALRDVLLIGRPEWSDLLETGRTADASRLAEIARGLTADDPVNIQYTSGTTGFPKARRCRTTTSSTTASWSGAVPLHRGRPGLRAGAVLPLLRHGDGQPGGDQPRCVHRDPCPAFDPEVTLRVVAQERCTSLYGVPTMFIAELALPSFDSYDLSSLRTGIMAGSPCPVEVMKQVVERMG